jgi:formiminoglutamate deiminase
MSASLVAAAADAGIRLTLLDTCYLRGGFDAPLAPEQLRFGDADVDAWAARATARSEAPGLRLGAAVHSVRAVAPEAMAVVAETARAHGWPLHIHVSEQPAENEAALAHTGRTPVALAAEAGVLGPATTAIHATHVDDDDIRCLAEADTGVCLCPTTEADLGDGIADTVGLWQVPVCIGTDSHACIDGFEEARRIELDTRLRRQRRGVFPAAALLDAATAHGHAALGWDAGRLTPGALADFVTLDITSPRLAGFDAEHAAAHVVFAAAAADVRTVVVGGRVVADR